MTELNPAQFKLLLAGPKVSRLMPFVTQRGYYADGCVNGSETLELLRQSPVHVLLVELDLDDMLLADLLQTVRNEHLAGAVILLDDPAKSGLIVSQLIRGVDGYVATPPDEEYLFRIIERQLLAQWAVAQMSRGDFDSADKQRLEKAVQVERNKVTELVKEIASLRDQLAKAKKARGAMDVPDTQLGMAKKPNPPGFGPDNDSENDDDSEAVTLRAARAVATQVRSDVQTNGSGQDDRTSPAGFRPPPELRRAATRKVAGVGKAPGADVGFDDVAHTRPSMGTSKNVEGEDRLLADDLMGELDEDDEGATAADDDGDLFLELEDPTLGDQPATQKAAKPAAAKKRP